MKTEISAEQYRQIINKTLPEREWRQMVKEDAINNGWQVLLEIPDKAYRLIADAAKDDPALYPVMTALRGWPDLLLGHPGLGEAIAIELKTARGKPNQWQLEKLPLLNACGIEARIWRPGTPDKERILSGGINGT